MKEKVSKGMRFDVFHRDAFTCQYCGRKPPMVVLNADHILAVSLGGKTEMDNLITACFECNNGKRDKPMSRVMAPLNFSVDEHIEKLEQIQAYEEYLLRQTEANEKYIETVIRSWAVRSGQKPDSESFVIPAELEMAVRRFLRFLMPQDMVKCIHIAFDRYPHREPANSPRFKFFCGVCWRTIKQNEENVRKTIQPDS